MSSGQPVKNQADVNRFRQEYIDNLQLEIKNNDYNLQMNKNYIANGQLPASADMMDTRTNSERLADSESLKRDIVDKLRPIAESNFGYAIVQRILDSPINIDNGLFRFLAQRVEDIVLNLKKSYSYGVAGDINDVDVLVQFIQNMYIDNKGKMQTTKSYINSTGSQVSNVLLNTTEIDALLLQYTNLIKAFNVFKPNVINQAIITNKILTIERILTMLKNAIPTSRQLDSIIGDINNNYFPIYDQELFNNYFKLLQGLPKYNIVKELMNVIDMSLRIQNEKNLNNSLDNLIDLLSEYENPETIAIFREFTDYIRTKQADIYHNDNLDRYLKKDNEMRETEAMRNTRRVEIVNTRDNPVNAMVIDGNGMRQKKIMGRGLRPSVFVGFGINEINKKKLNEGILTIRRNTKSNIMGMPSRRVSGHFKNAVNAIIGGGMPDYEDLNKMDDDEKDYLNKIVKKSNLEDRLNIPAPSKDKQEKDIHQFEVLKGQIMAGNDNIKLVREFKLLIRKLSKQGLLPKADVEEILDILLDLNY